MNIVACIRLRSCGGAVPVGTFLSQCVFCNRLHYVGFCGMFLPVQEKEVDTMKNGQDVRYFVPTLFGCFEIVLMPFFRREKGTFFTLWKGMGK